MSRPRPRQEGRRLAGSSSVGFFRPKLLRVCFSKLNYSAAQTVALHSSQYLKWLVCSGITRLSLYHRPADTQQKHGTPPAALSGAHGSGQVRTRTRRSGPQCPGARALRGPHDLGTRRPSRRERCCKPAASGRLPTSPRTGLPGPHLQRHPRFQITTRPRHVIPEDTAVTPRTGAEVSPRSSFGTEGSVPPAAETASDQHPLAVTFSANHPQRKRALLPRHTTGAGSAHT